MTTLKRSIRFCSGSKLLDLADGAIYTLASGGWHSELEKLSMRLIVQAPNQSRVDQGISKVSQWLTLADVYNRSLAGDPVFVETKTCDALSATADLGATWLRKRIQSGNLTIMYSQHAQIYQAIIDIDLDVDPAWQRRQPEPFLVGASSTVVRTDGGLTASAALTARRVAWQYGAGVTGRVHWLYSDADCEFFCLAGTAGSGPLARYLASDNKLYMYDSAGNSAVSAPLSLNAGQEVDLLFVWNTATPAMSIYVNGALNGSTTTCSLYGSLGSELMANASFETHTGSVDDGVSDTWTSWTRGSVNDGAGARAEATATAQAGTRAVRLTSIAGTVPYVLQTIAVAAETSYYLTLYTRGNGSVAGAVRILDETHGSVVLAHVSTNIAGTSYTIFRYTFTTPPGTTLITLVLFAPPAPGLCYFDNVSLKSSTEPDTWLLLNPSGSHNILGAQLWPGGITNTEAADLYAYGRAETELPLLVEPSSYANSASAWKLYNIPGDALAPLRVVAGSTGGQDFYQVRLGYRPLRIPTTIKLECESGTLGANTASTADATASAGNVARFTPADQAWAARCTMTLAGNPSDVAALVGDYRLFLAGKDNASGVQVNKIRWKLVVAGQSEDYSDEYAFGAVSAYNLLDLGTFSLPPGAWPEESQDAGTDITGGSYITIAIEAKNTTGSGGGTLDMDALYLAPAEVESVANGVVDMSAGQMLLVDAAGMRETAIAIQHYRSMEFGAWIAYLGDYIYLAPGAGECGLLWTAAFRDAVEASRAGDTMYLYLYVSPRFVR